MTQEEIAEKAFNSLKSPNFQEFFINLEQIDNDVIRKNLIEQAVTVAVVCRRVDVLKQLIILSAANPHFASNFLPDCIHHLVKLSALDTAIAMVVKYNHKSQYAKSLWYVLLEALIAKPEIHEAVTLFHQITSLQERHEIADQLMARTPLANDIVMWLTWFNDYLVSLGNNENKYIQPVIEFILQYNDITKLGPCLQQLGQSEAGRNFLEKLFLALMKNRDLDKVKIIASILPQQLAWLHELPKAMENESYFGVFNHDIFRCFPQPDTQRQIIEYAIACFYQRYQQKPLENIAENLLQAIDRALFIKPYLAEYFCQVCCANDRPDIVIYLLTKWKMTESMVSNIIFRLVQLPLQDAQYQQIITHIPQWPTVIDRVDDNVPKEKNASLLQYFPPLLVASEHSRRINLARVEQQVRFAELTACEDQIVSEEHPLYERIISEIKRVLGEGELALGLSLVKKLTPNTDRDKYIEKVALSAYEHHEVALATQACQLFQHRAPIWREWPQQFADNQDYGKKINSLVSTGVNPTEAMPLFRLLIEQLFQEKPASIALQTVFESRFITLIDFDKNISDTDTDEQRITALLIDKWLACYANHKNFMRKIKEFRKKGVVGFENALIASCLKQSQLDHAIRVLNLSYEEEKEDVHIFFMRYKGQESRAEKLVIGYFQKLELASVARAVNLISTVTSQRLRYYLLTVVMNSWFGYERSFSAEGRFSVKNRILALEGSESLIRTFVDTINHLHKDEDKKHFFDRLFRMILDAPWQFIIKIVLLVKPVALRQYYFRCLLLIGLPCCDEFFKAIKPHLSSEPFWNKIIQLCLARKTMANPYFALLDHLLKAPKHWLEVDQQNLSESFQWLIAQCYGQFKFALVMEQPSSELMRRGTFYIYTNSHEADDVCSYSFYSEKKHKIICGNVRENDIKEVAKELAAQLKVMQPVWVGAGKTSWHKTNGSPLSLSVQIPLLQLIERTQGIAFINSDDGIYWDIYQMIGRSVVNINQLSAQMQDESYEKSYGNLVRIFQQIQESCVSTIRQQCIFEQRMRNQDNLAAQLFEHLEQTVNEEDFYVNQYHVAMGLLMTVVTGNNDALTSKIFLFVLNHIEVRSPQHAQGCLRNAICELLRMEKLTTAIGLLQIALAHYYDVFHPLLVETIACYKKKNKYQEACEFLEGCQQYLSTNIKNGQDSATIMRSYNNDRAKHLVDIACCAIDNNHINQARQLYEQYMKGLNEHDIQPLIIKLLNKNSLRFAGELVTHNIASPLKAVTYQKKLVEQHFISLANLMGKYFARKIFWCYQKLFEYYQLQASGSQHVKTVDAANLLLKEARNALDQAFLAFYQRHYGQTAHHKGKLIGIYFPIVPDVSGSETVDGRLTNYLEKQIKAKSFTTRFPEIYNFLLSVQPLTNHNYVWLQQLYRFANISKHESDVPEEPSYKGTKVNMIEFLTKAVVGVEIILIKLFHPTFDLAQLEEHSLSAIVDIDSQQAQTLSHYFVEQPLALLPDTDPKQKAAVKLQTFWRDYQNRRSLQSSKGNDKNEELKKDKNASIKKPFAK